MPRMSLPGSIRKIRRVVQNIIFRITGSLYYKNSNTYVDKFSHTPDISLSLPLCSASYFGERIPLWRAGFRDGRAPLLWSDESAGKK